MKLYRKRDLKKAGIYCIKNLINNKIYIGKSINIYERMRSHINLLNKKSKDENPYLINSWFKYGRDNFQYFVLEYLEPIENLLKERELFWLLKFNSLDKNIGYNLRLDSETKCIVHDETKNKLKKSRSFRKEKFPDLHESNRKFISNYWKNNPEGIKEMADKVSKAITKYNIEQYTKDMVFVKRWERVIDIIKENPTYKTHNIYSACSGAKPTIYGYIWKKVLKNDIVRSE